MNIFKIRSPLPRTDFAPYWDISLGQTQWNETAKIDAVRNWLISNEQNILDKFPVYNDGGTGLGNNSTTSRFGYYNTFDFVNECPELAELLAFLRKSYINFVASNYVDPIDLYFESWFNIVHNGQAITEHIHGNQADTYLSGNIHLDNYPTHTYYRTPYDTTTPIPFKNIKGGLTIFPGYVPHFTDPYESNGQPRVSIAFDLWTVDTYNATKGKSTRLFLNREIIQELHRSNKQ
jgi:hypothetical protein